MAAVFLLVIFESILIFLGVVLLELQLFFEEFELVGKGTNYLFVSNNLLVVRVDPGFDKAEGVFLFVGGLAQVLFVPDAGEGGALLHDV